MSQLQYLALNFVLGHFYSKREKLIKRKRIKTWRKVHLGVHISIKLRMSLKKVRLKVPKLTNMYEVTNATGGGEKDLSGSFLNVLACIYFV